MFTVHMNRTDRTITNKSYSHNNTSSLILNISTKYFVKVNNALLDTEVQVSVYQKSAEGVINL